MRYGALFPYAGARPLQEYFLPANDPGGGVTGMTNYTGPGSAPNFMPAGAIVPGFDNYWGGVEFIYGQASATTPVWSICGITPALVSGKWQFQMAPWPSTANAVRPLCVAIAQMAANTFGWFAVGGLVPVACGASIAAGTPFAVTATGQGGADTAGKEVENAIVIAPATTTVTKNATLVASSPIVQITGNNTIDGLFIGAAVSGTGIPAATVVGSLDPDGRRFTMTAGPGAGGANVNATAGGGIVLTGTYNDGTNFYNIAHLNRPFAQGRIT
jgi:hypothetical protein